MSGILHLMGTIYLYLAFMPYLSFLVIWFLTYLVVKERKKTTRITADITVFLLIGSVAGLVNTLFHSTFGLWMILLMLLIGFGLIGGYQYQTKEGANLTKAIKTVWRLSFLILGILYIVLLIISLFKQIFG